MGVGRGHSRKVGVWLVGAAGRVGSAVALGVAAMRRGLAPTTGLVTELPSFGGAGLIEPASIVVGGHEIRSETLLEAVQTAHKKAGLFDAELIRACSTDLRSMQRNIRRGTLSGASAVVRRLAEPSSVKSDSSAGAAVDRLAADFIGFKRRHRLDCIVVVQVASSEPAIEKPSRFASDRALDRALRRRGGGNLRPSVVYALAAIRAGCPYVNFTASTGIDLPVLRRRADEAGIAYMGRDGKTGETLVKSALAPMFAMRNLNVLSWVGENILGNRDGEVLSDPKTRLAKLATKDKTVGRIAGSRAATLVSIDYVPSLDDWKVAWDFIHFEGFLGTKMSMQFTWQGCDSILAAPLVIDLVSLAELEARRGRAGAMRHLGFFFKDPMEVAELDISTQWRKLVDHVGGGGPHR